MHGKERAIAPPFERILGCRLIPAKINTDLFGTFTGEIERTLSPYECAKAKCQRALEEKGGSLCLASEGSFGPHPYLHFIHADQELLFFTDKDLEFELTVSKISLETNFNGQAIETLEELLKFADRTLFPSHGLILRPHIRKNKGQIHKGIQSVEYLKNVFKDCQKESDDGKVWVETDMRAHMNPTRMKVIEELAEEMSARLALACPCCHTPGWGVVKKSRGLECNLCGLPTELVQSEIYGCCKCDYKENIPLNRELADPHYCPFCNP
ncbi:MAG: hypothetical protein JSS30_01510 [Verrucomicrobia bacterium]|nr:hypothetical protein [Verrucomicrobiota bacterium]